MYEHKQGLVKGFTERYKIKTLVYYETYQWVHDDAPQREKAMKKWNRSWKLDLINQNNPEWKDLSENLNE